MNIGLEDRGGYYINMLDTLGASRPRLGLRLQ